MFDDFVETVSDSGVAEPLPGGHLLERSAAQYEFEDELLFAGGQEQKDRQRESPFDTGRTLGACEGLYIELGVACRTNSGQALHRRMIFHGRFMLIFVYKIKYYFKKIKLLFCFIYSYERFLLLIGWGIPKKIHIRPEWAGCVFFLFYGMPE